ncbi:MAG: hypothetical protein FWC21_05100 [Treponema sp.]|nr:hypothetical protein [Treponema sp.]
MKKNLLYGASAAMLLAIISCGTTGNTETPEDLTNTLVITEMENYTGSVLAAVSSTSAPLNSMIAVGRADVKDNTVTLPLVYARNEETPWTETGEYFLILILSNDNNAMYYFSDGKSTAHKFNFTNKKTEIPLSRFNRN